MHGSEAQAGLQKPDEAADFSQIGKGNWACFDLPLERIWEAAAEWCQALKGVRRAWLCWAVSDRWCVLQQRLIQEVGWTPVVGFDPRGGQPTCLPGSIAIDFNAHFKFDIMYMHFPLEFAFLFAERLGFWHSDLLCSLDNMRYLRDLFESLPDGALAAVPEKGGRRNFFNFSRHRYWELVGCTTRGASESQFRHGSGWWRHIHCHPSCTDSRERRRRSRYYYDHGTGIMYWKRHYGGKVVDIPLEKVVAGHCTSINKTNYKRVSPGPDGGRSGGLQNLVTELDLNYDLSEVAKKLGIAHLL